MSVVDRTVASPERLLVRYHRREIAIARRIHETGGNLRQRWPLIPSVWNGARTVSYEGGMKFRGR
jgi:hypothetical protein